MIANLMFDLEAITISTTTRSGAGLFLGEVVATFGLLLVIFGVVRAGRPSVVAFGVGVYIAGAYFFTSSTSFANPAVTVARMFSDTFAGIDPADVPSFLVAQVAGTALAVALVWFLYPDVEELAGNVVVPTVRYNSANVDSMNTELLKERVAVHAALADEHRLAMVDELALSDRSPSELAAAAGIGSNLAAHHLDVLEAAGVVARSSSHGDGRRRYVRLRPEALTQLAPAQVVRADSVLFVCTHNSARSQLAAALWNSRSPVPATSAGSNPAARVHPKAVAVAAERGLDLSGARPGGYKDLPGSPELVVSVCDRAREGPWPFRVRHLHWSVADPVEAGTSAAFRRARDELAARVDRLVPHVHKRS